MRLIICLVALLSLAPFSAAQAHAHHGKAKESSPITATGSPIGGPFQLTDSTGRAVTDQTFTGKPFVVYFGYTSCPDVCPVTLGNLAQALDMAGEKAKAVQPLFITVDPSRDTSKVMKDYTAAIHSRLMGLTGTLEQTKSILQAYKAYAGPAPQGEDTPFLINHSDILYFMDSEGQFHDVLSGSSTPEQIAEKLRAIAQK